jgi:uncharacterized protein
LVDEIKQANRRNYMHTLLQRAMIAVASLTSLFLVGIAPAAADPPSWCASQGHLNSAESTICDSSRLWALDAQLNREYRLVLKDGDDPEGAKASQRDWLRARNGCEADENCLEAVYKSRIAFLSGLH